MSCAYLMRFKLQYFQVVFSSCCKNEMNIRILCLFLLIFTFSLILIFCRRKRQICQNDEYLAFLTVGRLQFLHFCTI